ncbi:MAG: UDP-3-O-(3-hydroxymyristoyl)glucosamine N-acyltransferase [Syntrophales bacterium]
MKKTVREVAELTGGMIIGNPDDIISRVCGIDEAEAGDLTFVANPKYFNKLEATRATAVLCAPGTACPGKTLIHVANPYVAFGRVLSEFYPEESLSKGIHSGAWVEPNAVISDEAAILPGVYIGHHTLIARGAVLYPGVYIGPHCEIGEDSILYPNVSVYRHSIIGRRVVLHAGVVIGGDGFGFALPGSENTKIPQTGYVQIDDDVEIGANSTVDRGTMSRTWIQRNVKIDNLVQIAHNVVIGENSIITAQVGISGSTKLGRSVIIGGQAGLVGHINIGDGVMIAGQSGVHKDIPPNQIVAGSPHLPHREWLCLCAALPKLPEMRRMIRGLEKRIIELEEQLQKKL